MMNLIVFGLLLIYACVITRKNGDLDLRWINVCHTLGVSSRRTHPRDVLDKLRTVMAQSNIFEEFVREQEDNNYEEVDDEDVELDPAILVQPDLDNLEAIPAVCAHQSQEVGLGIETV